MGQVNKLNYINQKLGSSASQGQQTTRTIFDTITGEVTTLGVSAPKYYEFFASGSANKTALDTNLPTGKLDSMESMVIKEVYFQIWARQSAPNTGYFNTAGWSRGAIMNIYVGNQCVLKNFNTGTQWNVGNGPMERVYAYDNGDEACRVRLLTDIVVPPQVDIKVTLQYPNEWQNLSYGTAGLITYSVMCQLSGYGTLFNAGSSL